jgi:hypothetical protein
MVPGAGAALLQWCTDIFDTITRTAQGSSTGKPTRRAALLSSPLLRWSLWLAGEAVAQAACFEVTVTPVGP